MILIELKEASFLFILIFNMTKHEYSFSKFVNIKAGYTDTEVAHRWIGAVIKKIIWAEALMQKPPIKAQRAVLPTDRPTIQLTDKVGYRVA